MRSRSKTSMSAFWCGLARLVKGKAARLRARRMRLETTMSDSGPVPRSHSPLVCVKLSRFIRGFLLAKQVAQPDGFFVGFRLDGAPQLTSEFHEFGLPGLVLLGIVRHLADVLGGSMDALQERPQRHPKDSVIVGTAEPALGLELHVLYTTHRTDQAIQFVGG